MKGDFNEECYRTACNNDSAVYLNHSTRKYYCGACAEILNKENATDAHKLYGHSLMTLVDGPMLPGLWNGDMRILFRAVEYQVEKPDVATWWSAHFVGEVRQAIKIMNPATGYTFLIDNKFGEGYQKVIQGGSPRGFHKSVSNFTITEPILPFDKWVKEVNIKALNAEQAFLEDAMKKADPEHYERIQALKKSITQARRP